MLCYICFTGVFAVILFSALDPCVPLVFILLMFLKSFIRRTFTPNFAEQYEFHSSSSTVCVYLTFSNIDHFTIHYISVQLGYVEKGAQTGAAICQGTPPDSDKGKYHCTFSLSLARSLSLSLPLFLSLSLSLSLTHTHSLCLSNSLAHPPT